MDRSLLTLAVMGVIIFVVPATATIVPLNEASLDDLLITPQPIDTVMTTPANNGSLHSTIYSQAYTNGSGLYAYLYQLENTGAAGDSILEMFTLGPFTGADENVNMGYLTGTLPPGFLAPPGRPPEPDGNVHIASATVSFYYGDRYGYSIDVGEHSAVMYIMSDLLPSDISGNVINSYTASGPVVGPVPEPVTMTLLGLGFLLLLTRRNK